MSPATRQLLAVFRARFDADADAGKTKVGQAFVQLFCQGLGHKGGGIDTLYRWVERHLDSQLGRRDPSVRRSRLDTAGEIVHVGAVRPEPGKHIDAWQRRELAKGADAEPDQQIGEFWPIENPDRQRRKESCRLTSRHDVRRISSLGRCEDAVCNTKLDVVPGRIDYRSCDRREQGQFPLVVTGRTSRSHHEEPGPDDLYARNDRFDSTSDRLEKPGVTTRIVAIDRELRTLRLRIATTLPTTHSFEASSSRTGNDAVGVQDSTG